jgi:SAM-dependent methyltransferase
MNWRWSSGDSYVTDSENKRRAARAKLTHVQEVRPAAPAGCSTSGPAPAPSSVPAWTPAGRPSASNRAKRRSRAPREYYSVELQDSLPDEEFDVITMWDVVEHLRDPLAVLRLLHGRLRRGGRLLMETGNYENWRRILEGERWSLYLLDHHFYFSPASLEIAVTRAGFSAFRTRRRSLGALAAPHADAAALGNARLADVLRIEAGVARARRHQRHGRRGHRLRGQPAGRPTARTASGDERRNRRETDS